jgi:hypothetical protein
MKLALCTLLAATVLGGCAQAPKPLYMWESFPNQQYETLLHEASSPDAQIQALRTHAEKARAVGAALPPGFRAHLGMLYLATGDASAARQMWHEEKAAFPESGSYINTLLKRLDKPDLSKAALKKSPT